MVVRENVCLIGQVGRQQEGAIKEDEHELNAAISQNSSRNIKHQNMKPSGELESPGSVKATMSSANESMKIFDRFRRQIIGIR